MIVTYNFLNLNRIFLNRTKDTCPFIFNYLKYCYEYISKAIYYYENYHRNKSLNEMSTVQANSLLCNFTLFGLIFSLVELKTNLVCLIGFVVVGLTCYYFEVPLINMSIKE